MILIGDVRERLKELPDESVNCCVTSPPYWGLRDYGTAFWDGGDASCDHQTPRSRGDDIKSGDKQGTSQGSRPNTQLVCQRCNAIRVDSQIGLEQTPDAFIAELVAVFREVKRVLRDDGTLWLNIGDSYWNNFGGGSGSMTTGNADAVRQRGRHNKPKHHLFKIKDLVGIPWMLAFALRADGWYLRQDIIWHKPNPMPESVTDRCTKSHEYIFLLSKSPQYHFDNEAIKEPSSNLGKTEIRFGGNKYGDSDDPKHGTKSGNQYTDTGKRNKRDVWTVTTRPFKGAHFATFPVALIEPCILAGCPKGGTVLDPFFGAGTTGLVAQRHNRKWIGCELNPEYAAIAQTRIEAESNLFTETM